MSGIGSGTSSSSSTVSSNVSGDQRQAVQTGSAFNLGSAPVSGKSTVATSIGGGTVLTGKSRLTINESLDRKFADDTVASFGRFTREVLDFTSKHDDTLAGLVDRQQSGVLSAVTGRAIGSDASRYIMPIAIGVVALAALYFLKGR